MESTKTPNSKNLTPVRDPLIGGFHSGGDLSFREELKEAKSEAIRRRLDAPKHFKEKPWYKVNPYTKRKVLVDPPKDLPDHLRQMMLKELLKIEKVLLKERKLKLKVIKELPVEVKWFFEELEVAEFAEYYHIQKWIDKLLYGHLRESEEIAE